MVLKSLALAGLAASLISLPVTLPVVAGTPVTLAVGALEISYDRRAGLDVDFKANCLLDTCPLAEVRFERPKPASEAEEPVRLIRA